MGYSGWRFVASSVLLIAALAAAGAQTPTGAQTAPGVTLFAAGSLKGALTEVTQAFTTRTGIAVTPTYGSSGLLRARIEGGAVADVFASADVASPQQLHAEGKSGDVTVFTRNRMCLLVKATTPATRSVTDILLDPAIRLITSTPKADPAGDYAEAIFAKVDATRPGALATLDAKALRLVGGPNAVVVPAGADLGVYLLETTNAGDAFLAYCSGFVASVAASSGRLRSIEMPPALAVRADYGVTLRTGAPLQASQLRDFMLSNAGQTILEKYGFSRV